MTAATAQWLLPPHGFHGTVDFQARSSGAHGDATVNVTITIR